MSRTPKHGWCQRCGIPYERQSKPACECAGEPPVRARDGARLPNFHPDMQAYNARVKALHYLPTCPRCEAAGQSCGDHVAATADPDELESTNQEAGR